MSGADVVDADRAIGAADDDDVTLLEADTDKSGLLRSRVDEDAVESQIAIFDRVENKAAIDSAGNELLGFGRAAPALHGLGGFRGVFQRLNTKTPYVPMRTSRLFFWPPLLQIPFGDSTCVTDTEQPELSLNAPSIGE